MYNDESERNQTKGKSNEDMVGCYHVAYEEIRKHSNRKQEAQLSQRDRTMIRVIEYFAKSLKLTQGHSK